MSSLKYFTTFIFFFFCLNVTAQSVKNVVLSIDQEPFERKITGRYNFTGFVDVDQSFSVGAEYRFNPNWSAGSDAGYIFYSWYLSKSKHVSGLIFRPFIRYYSDSQKKSFFEAAFNYKHASYRVTDWIGKDVTNGMPAYEEYTTFQYKKNVMALNVKAGSAVNLSRNKRWRLEFYVGAGVRFKKQGADEGSYARHLRGFIDLYEPNYISIDVPLGMRLVYDIW